MNFGVVCEFNPFHAGHAYIFDKARELGADNIVCAMSGNAVQRGELAMLDKYKRSEVAALRGADLVLELPYPYSSASAEYFAMAGIRILAPFCDALIFGSECGDIELLRLAAELSLSDGFLTEFDAKKRGGEGAASAYFSLIEEKLGVKLSSNDILGVEYIKAAKKLGVRLDFFTVKRLGNAYRNDNLEDGNIPSASAIRRAVNEENIDALLQIDPQLVNMIKGLEKNGEIIDVQVLERACLACFRLAEPCEISAYAECDGGVAERICLAAKESSDLDEFWNAVKTKRYTDAKLRRAMLFALTRVDRELLMRAPEYTFLLAANERGRELLSVNKKVYSGTENGVKIITKPADAPKDTRQFAVEERLNSLFMLAQKKAFPTGEAYRKNAFIIK